MTTTAAKALELALHVVDMLEASDLDLENIYIGDQHYPPSEMRAAIRRGLESLRQGPLMLDAIEIDKRLRAASVKAGSDAALASKIGITRQSLADVLSGKRQPGPAVLSYLKLRKVATGRTLYTPVEDGEIKPKAPRSERRQRAWDGPAGAVTDSAPAP